MKQMIANDKIVEMLEHLLGEIEGLERKMGYAVAIEQDAIFQEKQQSLLRLQMNYEQLQGTFLSNQLMEKRPEEPVHFSWQPKYSY